MADHLVAGADGETLDVPVAHEGLPRLRLGEATVDADRLDEAGELGRGGDVRAHDAAGAEGVGGRVETLPGRQHVEDDPVGALAGGRQRLGQVAEREPPGGMGLPLGRSEELVDVAAGDVGELFATFVRRHPPVRADGPEEGAGEGAGADAGLHDVGTGEDVGERDDLRGVLGVDDGRAARHRDHELREQRSEAEVLPARGGDDREALLAADQLVVLDVAAVGEEPLAGHQLEVVPAALLVDQPDPLALAQRAAVDAGPGLGGDVRTLLGHERAL